MKTEKEIKEYLEKYEFMHQYAQKMDQTYLELVLSGVIKALNWVLK